MERRPVNSVTVIRESAEYAVIRVTGDLDYATAPELAIAAEQVLARGRTHLRVDLGQVEFFDAGGVRAIQTAAAAAHDVGGTLRVVDPSRIVVRILGVVDLLGLVESQSATGGATPAHRTAAERRARILGLVDELPADDTAVGRLGAICAEVTRMTGAGIMLISSDAPQVSVGATNTASELIERLQYELGEGPCVDAHHHDRPVLEPDLAAPAMLRWPAFRGPVLDAGVRAVFGFPLRVGAVKLGALNLHRDTPGPLTDDQHADALVMADIAASVVLGLQAEAPPGQLAAELEAQFDSHLVVHQATGMVAVQLGVGVAQASVRLRAHAFSQNQPLHEVARRVVDRELRFEEPDPEGPPS